MSEDLEKELSALKAENADLKELIRRIDEDDAHDHHFAEDALYFKTHFETLEKQLAVAVEVMQNCWSYLREGAGQDLVLTEKLDKALATIKAMQAGGEKV